MRIIIQRVLESSVKIDGQTVGSIGAGLMCLVGFGKEDTSALLTPMLEKVVHMRIFENDQGRFDRSLLDIEGGLLLVPQFTLYADLKKGRRPDFNNALTPHTAKQLFSEFVDLAQASPVKAVACGQFGADMKVALINDGPVTIIVDSDVVVPK